MLWSVFIEQCSTSAAHMVQGVTRHRLAHKGLKLRGTEEKFQEMQAEGVSSDTKGTGSNGDPLKASHWVIYPHSASDVYFSLWAPW